MDYLGPIVELKNIISAELIEKTIPLINKKASKKLSVIDGLIEDIRKFYKGITL